MNGQKHEDPNLTTVDKLKCSTVPFSYSAYFVPFGMIPVIAPPYLVIGDCKEPGWLVHISVIRQHMDQLMGSVLAYLIKQDLTFSIPEGLDQHTHILDGRTGLDNVAKVVNIHIVDDSKLHSVLSDLIRITNGLAGPAIYNTISISQLLFVSWGTLKNGYPISCGPYGLRTHLSRLRALVKSTEFLCTVPSNSGVLNILNKKSRRMIGLKYIPLNTLKADPKGNVLRCIRINRLADMDWCILKYGERYQSFDDSGRDIRDRLAWQYQLHQELSENINIPRAYDLFALDNNVVLALEMISGASMAVHINEILGGKALRQIPAHGASAIISLLLKALTIISELHRAGYVHRDINPENFMVTEMHEVYLLDLELCYSLTQHLPDPPFALGTDGYMSPQQAGLVLPEISDDIYGIGATLIRTLTGLPPARFDHFDQDRLNAQLRYFIPDGLLRGVITTCLHHSVIARPSINDIIQALKGYDPFNTNEEVQERPDHHVLAELAKAATATFLSSYFTDEQKRWHMINDGERICSNIPFGLLAWAKQLDLELLGDQEVFEQNLHSLAVQKLPISSQINMAALNGLLDSWVAYAELENAALVDIDQAIMPWPTHIMDDWQPWKSISLVELAVHGHHIMSYLEHRPSDLLKSRMRTLINELIRRQENNGFWSEQGLSRGLRSIPFGLKGGGAGLIYLMIRFVRRFNNPGVDECIKRGLLYLLRNRTEIQNVAIWTASKRKEQLDPWLSTGFTGIAYVFIQAFELYRTAEYKEAAASALSFHPDNISSPLMGFGDGLSGLAEVYFSAYRVFQEQEWQRKAFQIIQLILHTGCQVNGYHFWPENGTISGIASPIQTHAGIVYCLLRSLSPDKGEPQHIKYHHL